LSPAHVIYIPCVLFAGIAVGYLIGLRAARAEASRRKAAGTDLDGDL